MISTSRPPTSATSEIWNGTRPRVGYTIAVSRTADDPEWDAFLAQVEGGHHTQTSMWARAKAHLSWSAVRLVVRQGGEIVAGFQMLLRPLPVFGALGYVPRGPVVTGGHPQLAKLLMSELLKLCRRERVQYLSLQPPSGLVGEALEKQLPGWGFQPSSREVEPTATVILDLSESPEDLLAQMKIGTRYNVRLGQRKGITARTGTVADLGTFYKLLSATASRQNFSTHPESYFAELLRVFGERGHAQLFFSEYEGETVSAMFALAFGDTFYVWRAAWSGQHGNRRPNEVLHWTAINWARSQGYRYYDFEGISPKLAQTLVQDEAAPGSEAKETPVSTNIETVALFKVGFGGRIAFSPGAYDFVPNPVLRWGYRSVVPVVARWPLVARLEEKVRGVKDGS